MIPEDWSEILKIVDQQGFVQLRGVLGNDVCEELRQHYDDTSRYRQTISMERYRFGRGEYKYFAYPLPTLIAQLRKEFYKPLAGLANDWMQKLGEQIHYPLSHTAFIDQCRQRQQLRPTPLILKYQAGGFNTLHQDLYGEVYFPFQVVLMLSERKVDYTGGELVFAEQLPRAQSKASVLYPHQGDAVIFTTHFRPVHGSRGYFRSRMKHGVSPVHSGERYALGIIFHDAT